MHEAFLPICLLRNYPYALECLTCYDNFLLVGTKQGLLLVYEITPKSLSHPVYFIPSINPRPISKKTVRLSLRNDILEQPEAPDPHALPAAAPIFSTRVHTTRTFGRKPILQLAAIPELDLLLALAEGQMNVYQLQNCQLIATVPTSKGATVFAYYYSLGKDLAENQSCLSGSDSGTSHNPSSYFTGAKLYICVGVKRRLFFWRWDFLGQKCVRPGGPEDRLSCDWSPELTLSDTARVMQFQGPTHLIVGTRAEYCQVTLSTGEVSIFACLHSIFD
ncbi:unnamed protein product [Dicrocoelium dendriticum]|nr:unnamed protein product [Dicrocoelium dendriticum]